MPDNTLDVEVFKETTVEPQDIDILEKEFNDFTLEVEAATVSMGTDIRMDELDDLGEDIIKASKYLSEFASGEKKSFTSKAYNQLTALPLFGEWAKKRVEDVEIQDMKNSGVEDVINGIFNKFATKKKRLVELTYLADTIRTNLLKQEKKAGEYIIRLEGFLKTTKSAGDKLRALDMSIQAQSNDKIIKNQVYNQLEFIMELMTTLSVRMGHVLAGKKAQLLNSTSIAGMITSISDTVKMMETLQNLTNDIDKKSTANIQGLIVDVSKSMSKGVDMEFFKESTKTNAAFHQTMIECQVEHIKTTQNNYTALKQINIDTSNQLEHRVREERKALGMTITTKKESLVGQSA